MTTYLERTPAAYYDDTPTVPFEIPTVIETTDGCAAGQRLNAAVKALVEEAKESELPSDDGTFLLGDINGEHLTFSQETDTTRGIPVEVSRLEVVAPADNLRFYYRCSEVSDGDKTVVDFTVHEEGTIGGQKSAQFIGTEGTQLSGVAAEISTQLAVKLLDVANAQNLEGGLSNKTLHDIADPLTTPETTYHQTTHRWLGNTAISRLLSRFGSRHAAA